MQSNEEVTAVLVTYSRFFENGSPNRSPQEPEKMQISGFC